jgi:hypothetical protein
MCTGSWNARKPLPFPETPSKERDFGGINIFEEFDENKMKVPNQQPKKRELVWK